MHKVLFLTAALTAPLLASGQVRLVAGWDFGQFVLSGWSSTDPNFTADGASIPANHSESAAISPVVTHENGQPASAGTGAIFWDGSFGSSSFNAAFDGEVQSSPGTREVGGTVPGTTVIGAATFARTLSNIDSDPADQALLVNGAAAKTLALRVDLTGHQDFEPAANGGFANLALAAASNSGATLQWSLGDAPAFATTNVPPGTLTGFATYAVDLPASAYGSEATLRVVISGGLVVIDNVQINGVPAEVVVPPSIATPPSRQIAAPGGTASFTVATSGPAPLSYRWQRGETDLADDARISGSGTATLTISDITEAELGLYRVVVTFPEDVVLTSDAAALVFEFAPVFTTQPPATASVLLGGDITLSAVVDGAPEPALRWHKDDQPLEDGPGISGATTGQLMLSDVTASSAGAYTLVATNSVGERASDPVQLSVEQPLVIVTPPALQIVAPRGQAQFTVAAQGEGELAYQWLKGDAEIDGADSATLTLENVGLSDTGLYSVRVTDDNGSLTSSAARLIVGYSVAVNTKVTQTFVPGLGLVLSANATPPEGGSYQWLRGGKVIPGATSATLVLSGATIADSGTYSVRLLNAAGRVVSTRTIAKLSISPAATYDALVRDSESEEPIGRVQVSVTSKGAFTGQLRYEDGKTYAFRGTFVFAANGHETAFTGSIKRKAALAPLAYELALDAQAQELGFSLREGDTALGSADGLLRLASSSLPAWSGTYALSLAPLPTELPNQPSATAVLKSTVARKGGTMKLTGKLADGTSVTANVPASVEAAYAVWLNLYSAKGRLVGDLRLEETAPAVFAADLESSGEWFWLRPANPKSKVFPGGIDLLLEPTLAKPASP